MKKEWRALMALVAVAMASALAWTGYRYVEVSAPGRAASARPILGQRTEVFFRVTDPTGRIDMTGLDAKSLGLLGRPVASLSRAYPGWRVAEVLQNTVILVPAPGRTPIYLGLKDGFVAIFLGEPGNGIVDEITGIPAKALMPEDRTRLARGVGVSTLKEAWSLLEGLAG